MQSYRHFATLSSALALAACATGPDYRPQPIAQSAAAPFVMAQGSTLVSDQQPAGNWWRLYRDPVLDSLVRDALASNTDVQVAEARLQRARAALREERGAASRRPVLAGARNTAGSQGRRSRARSARTSKSVLAWTLLTKSTFSGG